MFTSKSLLHVALPCLALLLWSQAAWAQEAPPAEVNSEEAAVEAAPATDTPAAAETAPALEIVPAAEEAPAAAEAAPDDDGHLELKLIPYLSLGPTVGALILRLSHKKVYGHSDNRLMDGLYWQAGAEAIVSPGTFSMKLFAEWVPVAVLKLHASYAATSYLGTPLGLGHSLTFADANSPSAKADLKERAGEEVAHLAHRGTFTLTLRAQLGFFIFFSDSELAAWYMPEVEGPGFGYDSYYDTLVRRGTIDGTFMNRTAILFEVWKGEGDANVRIGAVHQYVRAFDTGRERSRIGAMITVTPWDELGGIKAPMLVLAPGVTLIDQNRQYEFWAELALVFRWDVND